MLDFLEEASWVTLLVIGAVVAGIVLVIFALFLWPKGNSETTTESEPVTVPVASEGGNSGGTAPQASE